MQFALCYYLYAPILGQCSKNPLKPPRIGRSILTIISLNLAVSHFQRPSTDVYVKACSKADLLLDNNFSVIVKMGCSDAPKPIVHAFLRPSIIFFPTVFISYISIYLNTVPKILLQHPRKWIAVANEKQRV